MCVRERERESENNSRVLKNMEIHQYKVKIKKIIKKKLPKEKEKHEPIIVLGAGPRSRIKVNSQWSFKLNFKFRGCYIYTKSMNPTWK